MGFFDLDIGLFKKFKSVILLFIEVYFNIFLELVKKDEKIVGVIVVMFSGIGLDKFIDVYFLRFFDVVIVE